VRFVDALNDLQVAHVPIEPQTESFLGVALRRHAGGLFGGILGGSVRYVHDG
jgi:hypothetical protein